MKRKGTPRKNGGRGSRLAGRGWRIGVTCIAVLAAFCTVYALVLPATALEGETYCGYTEHVHSDACYETVLVCGQEESAEHTHSDACYEQVLVCGLPEHVHSDACYVNPDAETVTASETVEETAGTEAASNGGEATQSETTAPETVTEGESALTEGLTEGESSGTEGLTETETETAQESETETETEETETETETETEEEEPVTLVYDSPEYIVTVTYGAEAQLPENTVLTVKEYDKDSETYKARYAEAAALYGWPEETDSSLLEVLPEGKDVADLVRLFDIALTADGVELTPAAEVNVSVIYLDGEIQENEPDEIRTLRFDENEITKLESTVKALTGQETVQFSAAKFSDFMLYDARMNGVTVKTKEPMVEAVVYTSDSLTETLSDVSIQITGQLPEGVTATAWPTEVEIQDETVLVAYDITLWLDGEEYEPDSAVKVTIQTPELADTESASVYHIAAPEDGEKAAPELVAEGVTVADGAVQFDADGFSTYAVTVAENADEGIATASAVLSGTTITMDVGDTYTLKDYSYVSNYSQGGQNYRSSSSNSGVATLSVNSVGAATITAVGAGTATVTIYYSKGNGSGRKYDSVDYTVIVKAANGPYTVTYVVDSSLEQAGSSYSAASQEWSVTGTVSGLSGLTETVGDSKSSSADYTVRAPFADTRTAYADKKSGNTSIGNMLMTYTFLCWEGSDGKTYTAGDGITLTGDLTLTAKWCLHFEDTSSAVDTVSFWIAIADTVDATDSSNYTDALYTTKVVGTSAKLFAESNGGTWYGGLNNDISVYETYNKYIRNNYANGIARSDGSLLTLASFPDDDTIFSMIREWGSRAKSGYKTTITVDNVEYDASEITADNFEIYWYVVKYDGTDGWHIDGILRLKEAKLTVTKTFVGSDEAVEAAQNGFCATVSGNSASYKLALTQNECDRNVTLYHDVGSNTYTWEVTGLKQHTNYIVTESDYGATVDNITYNVTSSYQITNSKTTDNTDGWMTYPADGVTVTCSGYQSNVTYTGYQTVSLRNVYTKPYVMTILKQDGTSYNGLNGVSFTLTVTDSYGTNKIDGKTVTTNSGGQIEINFRDYGPGTYTFTLKEQEYTGYKALANITGTAEVDNNGYVTVNIVNVGVEGENSVISVDTTDPSIVYIQNISERTSVTVNKVWTDGTEKQVSMQLMRNGTLLTDSDATCVLNNSNNWSYTWGDLPLYVDGEPAVYSVRETWIGVPGAIGSSSYTAADDADGYKDYIVTTSSTQNTDGSTTITVTNTKDDGQVVFTKVDESGNTLAGAKFTVYMNSDCTQSATIGGKNAVFTSDANGVVTIVGLKAGTYYVKETSAPSGYAVSDTVYTLNVKENNSTLTLNGNTVSTVVNKKSQIDVTLKKVDAADDKVILSGAEFTLTMTGDDGKRLFYTVTDSGDSTWMPDEYIIKVKDGVYTFSGLESGTYTLTETKAPDGYNLLTDKITITVTSSEVIAAYGGGSNCIAKVTENDDGTYTVTVKNSTGTELPNTGGIGTNLVTTGGLLLMATAVVSGYGLRRRRGKGAR